jgi:2-phospho-L-lactate guanylyltransferase
VSAGACFAIIAVNERTRCKTRLEGVLGLDARVELARAMLERVLAAARAVPAVDEVLVVSPERDRVPDDVPVLHDAGNDLNAAMDAGRRAALARGATAMLLLPADLPLLRAADLRRLVLAGRHSGVAIAPDRHGSGTNGLYLVADAPLPFRFGPDSRVRHQAEARRLGLRARLVRTAGLQSDLDTVEDVPGILACPEVRWPLPAAAVAAT